MPASSQSDLPEGVSENDLYDGPKVVHLASNKASFLAPDPQPPGSSAAPSPAAAALVAPIPQQAPPTQPNIVEPPRLSAAPAPQIPVSPAPQETQYLQVVTLALDILSARLLGLIALLAAVAFWGMVVYDPSIPRIEAASAFSLLVFGPIMVIYWRAGLTGEGS